MLIPTRSGMQQQGFKVFIFSIIDIFLGVDTIFGQGDWIVSLIFVNKPSVNHSSDSLKEKLLYRHFL